MTSFRLMLLRLVCGQRGVDIYQDWRRSVHNLRNKIMISEEKNRLRQVKIENDLIESLKR